MKPPPKHKDRDDWTMDEVVAHMQTGAEPVSDDYADYVRDLAAAGGLAAEDLGLPAESVTAQDPENLTVEDLIERQRNRY